MLCRRAECTGRHVIAPLVVFAVAATALIMLSGWGSDVGGVVARWMSWTDVPFKVVSPNRLLMVLGLVLLQLMTGQPVGATGAEFGRRGASGGPAATVGPAQGRPPDRTHGTGGQLAAATAVVAAKSIVRFPEINAQKARENGTIGIDDVVEYFLVGSFGSCSLRRRLCGLSTRPLAFCVDEPHTRRRMSSPTATMPAWGTVIGHFSAAMWCGEGT